MDVSGFIDDCFVALCIPSKKCGILWGASCIILNCHECICKKNAPCRKNAPCNNIFSQEEIKN